MTATRGVSGKPRKIACEVEMMELRSPPIEAAPPLGKRMPLPLPIVPLEAGSASGVQSAQHSRIRP